MSLLHLTFERDTQIFIVGFFAAMFTLWPLCLLVLIPYDVYLAKHVVTAKYKARLAQLEKENKELFLSLMDHKGIIDALLKESFEDGQK